MKRKLLGIFLSILIISVCAGCGGENTSVDTVSDNISASEDSVSEENLSENEADTSDEESADDSADNEENPSENEIAETNESSAENSLSENDTNLEDSAENTEDSAGDTADDDTEDTEDGATDDTEEISDDTSEEPIAEPQAIYTYTEMTATLYATQTVNVRNLPDTTGETLGSLSTNQEITVTAQCNETGWYMFDYNGQIAFASNTYLSETPVEVAQDNGSTSAPAPDTSALPSFPYPLHTWTLQTSAEGCPIYVIYTTYTNIGDIRWGTPSPTPDIFSPEDDSLIWNTVADYAIAHGCGFHFLYPVTKVGDYAEGTIYQCIAGAHYSTGGACPVFDPAICQVGTVD